MHSVFKQHQSQVARSIEVSAPCFPRKSFALAEQLTLLPKNLLEQGRYCGTLDAVQMKRLQDAIKIQLSLD